MKKAMIDFMQKAKNDKLYTPDIIIYPIIKYIPKNIKTIWECTDYGNSNITKILKNNGYNVISTDIINGFNFLNDKIDSGFDMIITNPPYSLKDEFLEKCYIYNKPFMLLLPITAFEGIERNKLYREYGISCIVIDRRVDFSGKGNNWFNTSWFFYDKENRNKLYFEKI